mgnify:CR=1 FL=1
MASFDCKFNSTPLGGFSYDFAPASGRENVPTDTNYAGLPIVTNNKTTRKHERVNLDGSINQQGKSYKSCACGLMAASNRQGKCNVCGDATRWIKKPRKRRSCQNARPKKRRKKEQVPSEQFLPFFDGDSLELSPAEEADFASLMDSVSKQDAEFKAKEQAITIREQALAKQEAAAKAKEQAITIREQALAKREAEFKAKEQAITIREQALAKRVAEFEAKEQAITIREQALAKREQAIKAELKTPAFSLELDEEDLFNIASMEARFDF